MLLLSTSQCRHVSEGQRHQPLQRQSRTVRGSWDWGQGRAVGPVPSGGIDAWRIIHLSINFMQMALDLLDWLWLCNLLTIFHLRWEWETPENISLLSKWNVRMLRPTRRKDGTTTLIQIIQTKKYRKIDSDWSSGILPLVKSIPRIRGLRVHGCNDCCQKKWPRVQT